MTEKESIQKLGWRIDLEIYSYVTNPRSENKNE